MQGEDSLNKARDAVYRAFREVGRAVATVQLLKFISDPSLRRRVTAATNKVESFNNFTDWLAFCNGGVIAEKRPGRAGEGGEADVSAGQLRDLPYDPGPDERGP